MTLPKNVTIILVRGLFGMVYSRGMDALAAKLQRAGYKTQVWNHSWLFIAFFGNSERIAAEVRRLLSIGQTPILIGHSFGANTILIVARILDALGVKLPLVCAVDPAQQYDCSIPKNVQRALGFYELQGGLGQGVLTPKGDPRITEILTPDVHIYIDKDPAVHNRIIAEITKV